MSAVKGTRALAWTSSLSLVALYVGVRWGMLAETHADLVEGLCESLSADLAVAILLDPLDVRCGQVPLICGLTLFCAVWYAYVAFLGKDDDARHGDEHGSARRGGVSAGRRYRDARDPDNNIVLTRRLGVAIEPAPHVRATLPSRNVCVVGPTGTGKTTGYVMPNVLQMAKRDMVVVDPKGTVLATCGHALAEAGFEITLLDTVDMSRSDRYNPLAYVRTHADVTDFVSCLMDNTNDGKRSSEPIWDGGEALLYRAIVTLLLEWFPRRDLTMASVVALADMASVGADGEEGPLDLLFREIERGVRLVAAPGPRDGDGSARSMGPEDLRGSVVEVPSLMMRRDGTRPALATRPDGSRGLDPSQDEALRIWHEFRHGAAKTLRSFVISSHARLAYLSTPDVLGLLAGGDGRDGLRLDLLGRTEDEWGRPLPPRVLFVVSSDHSSGLRALLSLVMWQAVQVPMATAREHGGSLPRPLSIVIDEFRNVGRIAGFDQAISVVRSRNVDVSIVLQTLSQLEDVYGRAAADTIRGNCPVTLVLGGGRDAATSRQVSSEIGRGTVYVESVSRQGSGMSAGTSVQTSSVARDVLDPNEVATLASDRALVLMGQEQVIEDAKAHVWHHRRYDEAYMGRRPRRSFDYAAWREAGRPKGEALGRWEAAWFGRELPAREALSRAGRARALAAHELDEARRLADPARVRELEDTLAARDADVGRAREVLREAHEASLAAVRGGAGQGDA